MFTRLRGKPMYFGLRGKPQCTSGSKYTRLLGEQISPTPISSPIAGEKDDFSTLSDSNTLSNTLSDSNPQVNKMISEMIDRLRKEAAEQAEHNSWCKAETAKANKSHEVKTERVQTLSTRLEVARNMIAKLKGEIKGLQNAIAEIISSAQEATAIRNQEKAEFDQLQKDLNEGQKAVRTATRVLSEYYGEGSSSSGGAEEGPMFVQSSGNTKKSLSSQMASMAQTSQHQTTTHTQNPRATDENTGAATSILGQLEQIESQMASQLAEATTAEELASEQFTQLIQDNRVSKSTKDQDIKGKMSHIAELEQKVQEHTADLRDAMKQLEAVKKYQAELKKSCEPKAMSYEERKKRSEAEIAGVKQALVIMTGDADVSVRTEVVINGR